MKTYSKVKGNKDWTVKVMNDEHAILYSQSVNPKTGKGWQKTRDDQVFTGHLAATKAMRAWLYAK